MSERLLQSDPRLSPAFRRYGCNARSTLGLVETFVGAPLSLDQLQDALAQMQEQGLVTDAWSMHRERSFRDTAKIAARIFSRPNIRCEQVGRVYLEEPGLNRIILWGGWRVWTASIVHYNSQSPDGHYVEGDAWLRDVFNPDPTVRITTLREALLYRVWEEDAA